MFWNRLKAYILGFTMSERIVNRIAQSEPIKKAARVTAYTMLRTQETVNRKKIEYKRAGGTEKLKQVTKDDFKKGTQIFKEMVTYDIPETIKKIIRDLSPKNRPRND
ncbi:unnamed protein product [Brachionus calyciflorus]|uniref:Uncharacterized protein n=1 Tax=Brachionus calyciflorus TaxID=104777 RepID=A0A814AUY0_9BILA|nr:unnamed protein product [Brachionus calyciflorus]